MSTVPSPLVCVALGCACACLSGLCQPSPPRTNLVWCPPGSFLMGSPSTELNRQTNEGPQTLVTLTTGFWISKFETTQDEFASVYGLNPSRFTGDSNRPVEQVN